MKFALFSALAALAASQATPNVAQQPPAEVPHFDETGIPAGVVPPQAERDLGHGGYGYGGYGHGRGYGYGGYYGGYPRVYGSFGYYPRYGYPQGFGYGSYY